MARKLKFDATESRRSYFYGVPTEHQEQKTFVDWLKLMKIPFYHIPNGGSRHKAEATNLSRIGVNPGVPDICIPVSNQYHHALYVEMKRKKGGSLSANQEQWINALIDLGNLAVVAKGADEAISIVRNYMSSRRRK